MGQELPFADTNSAAEIGASILVIDEEAVAEERDTSTSLDHPGRLNVENDRNGSRLVLFSIN
jgi:hypothetical protein